VFIDTFKSFDRQNLVLKKSCFTLFLARTSFGQLKKKLKTLIETDLQKSKKLFNYHQNQFFKIIKLSIILGKSHSKKYTIQM
jgi:pyoverdine/dityrosine biosynthesis protein Dit1